MSTLRDYQEQLIDAARTGFVARHSGVLVVAPTGAGKTVLFADICRRCTAAGTRVLVAAHRRELIRQASDKLRRAGVEHGVIAPGYPLELWKLIQVASIQTVARRLDQPEGTGYGLLILDEAHHSVAGQWAALVKANPRAFVLGVTATPERLDGRGLGRAAGGFYDTMIVGPTIADLTARGFLVPARVWGPAKPLDMAGVRKVAGDYDRGEVERRVAAAGITGDAVAHYRKLAPGQAAIAFCVSVKHAKDTAEAFRADGWRAVAVDGTTPTPERDAAFAGLASGEVQVLCTCDLVSEGLDVPNVAAVILLRPTNSLCLHVQQVGRGLRPADGKEFLVVLDHAGNCARHGLPDEVHEWSLEGKKARAGKKAAAVVQCPACYAIHRPAPKCVACGHSYEAAKSKRRALKVEDGELVEQRRIEAETKAAAEAARLKATPLRDLIASARNRYDLIAIARAKGFKTGWVHHILKDNPALARRVTMGSDYARARAGE